MSLPRSSASPSAVLGGAEGDGLEAGAIVGGQGEADMAALADDLGRTWPVRGEGEDRRRDCRRRRALPARGRGPDRRVAPRAVSAASIGKRGGRAGGRDIDRQRARMRKARNGPSWPGLMVTPAAMAWPPPLAMRPVSTASITARPRSTPGTERPEPVPVPSGCERDGEGRALEALAQARGDEADDAGVPVGRGEHQHRRALAGADFDLGRRAAASSTASTSMRWRSVLSSSRRAAMASAWCSSSTRQQLGAHARHRRCGRRH